MGVYERGVWYAGMLPRQAVWWVSMREVCGMQVCCLDKLSIREVCGMQVCCLDKLSIREVCGMQVCCLDKLCSGCRDCLCKNGPTRKGN